MVIPIGSSCSEALDEFSSGRCSRGEIPFFGMEIWMCKGRILLGNATGSFESINKGAKSSSHLNNNNNKIIIATSNHKNNKSWKLGRTLTSSSSLFFPQNSLFLTDLRIYNFSFSSAHGMVSPHSWTQSPSQFPTGQAPLSQKYLCAASWGRATTFFGTQPHLPSDFWEGFFWDFQPRSHLVPAGRDGPAASPCPAWICGGKSEHFDIQVLPRCGIFVF